LIADTFRTFKKTVLKDHTEAKESAAAEKAAKAAEVEAAEVEKSKTMQVGNRCELISDQMGSQFRRGCIAFLGTVEFQPGVWVGVKLDEPYGKNNGSVQGKQYFECFDKCGVFVKPSKINVGDFPAIVDPDEEF
jgi:tubulin-folding cofactor B